MTVLCGAQRCPSVPALEALLRDREQAQARQAYHMQLLWLMDARLAALTGTDGGMPDYLSLFTPAQDGDSAAIRRSLLHELIPDGPGPTG